MPTASCSTATASRPRSPSSSTFKLAGLHEVTVGERTFMPDPLFDPNAEKYAGVTLFVIDRT